jgi:hypothetical protein
MVEALESFFGVAAVAGTVWGEPLVIDAPRAAAPSPLRKEDLPTPLREIPGELQVNRRSTE